MKDQVVTRGIVLARTNFQEADRILTVLTTDHGKVRLMAKGVRRPKSKLAGGIELFSESELTFLPTRGEIQTLTSSRIYRHFGAIVKDIQRTMVGYEFLKRINRVTEDAAGPEYAATLLEALAGLDDALLDSGLTRLWFELRLLDVSGHGPNLTTDAEGARLEEGVTYQFDFDTMAFRPMDGGRYGAGHIRLLRLARDAAGPRQLGRLSGVGGRLADSLSLTADMLRLSLRS